MKETLYTINEFADKAGIDKSEIYRQATSEESTLYTFVIFYRGKRYIKEEALQLFTAKEKKIEPREEEKQETKEEQNKINKDSKDEFIKFLEEQIKEKDKLIEDIRATKDREIAELHRLLFNQQELHAKDKALLMAYQEKEEQDKEISIEEQGVIEEKEEAQEQVVIEQEPQEPKKKRGFLSWLFGD